MFAFNLLVGGLIGSMVLTWRLLMAGKYLLKSIGYMLSMIDEDDLAEFVTETKKQETEQPTVITPQPETKPAVEETEKEPEKESKETNTGALLAIALLAVAGCGGVYYFKVVKPKKEEEDAGDEDLEFYEGDYINEDSENHMDEDDTEE